MRHELLEFLDRIAEGWVPCLEQPFVLSHDDYPLNRLRVRQLSTLARGPNRYTIAARFAKRALTTSATHAEVHKRWRLISNQPAVLQAALDES